MEPHERTAHEDAQEHHHHTHAAHSHHAAGHHLLQVEHLSVSFRMYRSDEPFFAAKQAEVETIHDLSLAVHAGEIVAVVGASGSGKTLVADAIMGLFEPNARVTGRVWFNGVAQSEASLAALRGRGISLVPQSVNHLDPLMKVGRQVEEFAGGAARAAGAEVPCGHDAVRCGVEAGKYAADARGRCGEGAHGAKSAKGAAPRGWRARRALRAERRARREELFARYGLGPEVADMYPHELSGGMARRVLLCCALMDAPQVIVADEPTPGLDLDLAVRALDDFRTFAEQGGGVLLITHDIELALRVADRVAVFKDGTVVEETGVEAFKSPDTLRHPFTRELWHALPSHGFETPAARRPAKGIDAAEKKAQLGYKYQIETNNRKAESGLRGSHDASEAPCLEARRNAREALCLEARDVSFSYPGTKEPLYEGLSFSVEPGQRVALSAPSGFGKTTLCKILAGYLEPDAGSVLVNGASLPKRGACPVQMIFQHPERSVDPRMRLEKTLLEGMAAGGLEGAEARAALEAWRRGEASGQAGGNFAEVARLLDALGIRPEWLSRFPHELSGGELQRFCIARALFANPRYLIADEMSTMLDAVTQAQIWRALVEECERRNMGLVFVSHSPELTGRIATHIVHLSRTSRIA